MGLLSRSEVTGNVDIFTSLLLPLQALPPSFYEVCLGQSGACLCVSRDGCVRAFRVGMFVTDGSVMWRG